MVSKTKRLAAIRLHSDPEHGSPYWIDFFRNTDLTVEEAAENPLLLPVIPPEIMRQMPLEHFVSRKVLHGHRYLISGETSGFSGKPITTAFTEEEFEGGFVTPFLDRAEQVGFPVAGKWLWAGPSGPHIIGKALRAIIRKAGGIDPFTIDFDPRWFKKLPPDSISQQRYFKHIEEQIFSILNTQTIDILFSTPPVIRMLMEKMPVEQRAQIKGVHYGGIAVGYDEYQMFQAAFPNAVHLNGYGNSLFGVFLEKEFTREGIEYSTSSDRIELRLVKSNGPLDEVATGERGQVLLSRYDESYLIINMLERDTAVKTEHGIKDPLPVEQHKKIKVLY